MKAAVIILAVVLAAAVCVQADQPAVTISDPDQGSKWKIGDTIPTSINWPNYNSIAYTDVKIALISGDPFEGFTTLQEICNPPGACPALEASSDNPDNAVIKISWELAPKVVKYGQATINVRAKWQATDSPVIDTLSQSLTILIVCPNGDLPNADGDCVTPSPTISPCPDGSYPVDGECPEPCPDGSFPVDGKCPEEPTPTPLKCPSGEKPNADGTVCEEAAATCPDGSPIPPDGECPSAGDKLPCILTQIGSDDFLCPKDGSRQLCCAGFCQEGNPESHFCCSYGDVTYSCSHGNTCCGTSCCPSTSQCCGATCCSEGESCEGGECKSKK